jgi:hypothetical protein
MSAKFLGIVFLFVFALPVVASDLPKNLKLEVQFQETLTSDSSETGQRFSAILNKSISAGGKVVFEKGTIVEGIVSWPSRPTITANPANWIWNWFPSVQTGSFTCCTQTRSCCMENQL